MKNNIATFYVGETIVCIKSHSRGVFTKGQRFIVKGIKQNCCGKWIINIGIITHHLYMECNNCGSTRPNDDYFGAVLFRSIEQKPFPLIKLSQIKEQELCAN